jgi:hypothetical protein
MDLGEALRRVNEKRYGSLNDSYFLFLTNPVDITTTLFASSSGINPQKVLGVCDNDRTRYITALSNYFKEAPHNYRLNETDRQKLSECFVGFGPHNEWGAITYASFVEGLEYLRSVVPHFSPDDPVALYTGLSQKVSAMGVAAFKTTGVLPDTSLDVVHLLNILFPHSCGEAVYSPSAVKALVFDEDAACYEGRMVAPVYGSQSLDGAPLLYTSSSRFVEEDVLTRENARLGSLAMGMIFDKMEEEGLLDRSLLRFC